MDRQHILDEIRRATEANGGKPLGRRRFESVTGIREPDWFGKHWARWSDAVIEAGYEPNVKQERLDDLTVLASLVEIIEALGKWPTVADWKLYGREHPDFPNPKTIRRLGGRGEQARAVIEHADELVS